MAKDEDQGEKILAAQLFVTRQFAVSGKDVGDPSQADETLAVRRFVTEPARVSVEMGMTVNLGNYESARITVALVVPCYYEERDAAYDFAKEWVTKRTVEEAKEARRFAQTRNPF